jgi:hypothetical protein
LICWASRLKNIGWFPLVVREWPSCAMSENITPGFGGKSGPMS